MERIQTRHATGAIRQIRVWNFSSRKGRKLEKNDAESESTVLRPGLKRAKKDKDVNEPLNGQKPLKGKRGLTKEAYTSELSSKGIKRNKLKPGAKQVKEKDYEEKEDQLALFERERNKIRETEYVSGSTAVTDTTPRLCIEKHEHDLDMTDQKQMKLLIPFGQEETLFKNLNDTLTVDNKSLNLFSLKANYVKVIQGDFVELDNGERAVKVPEVEHDNEIILIAVTNTKKSSSQEQRDCGTQTLEEEPEVHTVSDTNEQFTEDTVKLKDKIVENGINAFEIDHVKTIVKSAKHKTINKTGAKKLKSTLNYVVKVKENIPVTRPVIKTQSEDCKYLPVDKIDKKASNKNICKVKDDQNIQNDVEEDSAEFECPLDATQTECNKESMSGNPVLCDSNVDTTQKEDGSQKESLTGPPVLCDSNVENELVEEIYGVKSDPNKNKKKCKKSDRSVKRHVCSYCDKRFKSNRDLIIHVRTHTGERPYGCKICKKAFGQKSVLVGHMRTHTGEKPFVCQFCGKAFADATTLKVHVRWHTGERPYKCKYCEKTFVHNGACKSHMTVHTKEKKYMCHLCGKACTTSMALNSHLRVHTGEKKYPCKICDKRFHSTRNRRRHMAVHTGNRKYFMCEICGKSIASSTNFTKHKKVHLNGKPHACDLCDKRFRDKKCFMRHIQAHADGDPFLCEVCKMPFVRMSHLKRHSLTHKENTCIDQPKENTTVKKIYSCNFCDRRYKSRPCFIKHQMSHPEAQNVIYKCVVCDDEFATLAFLEEHVTLHGHIKTEEANKEIVYITEKLPPGKAYTCTACNELFYNLQTFEEHLKSHEVVNYDFVADNNGVIIEQQQCDGENINQELEPAPNSVKLSHVDYTEQDGGAEIDGIEQTGQIEHVIQENPLEHLDHLEEVDHIEHVIIEDDTGQPTVQTIVYVTVGTEELDTS